MGRWDDPTVRARARQLGGKVARAAREARRAEAEARNALTPHARTRAHREGRCPCWAAEPVSQPHLRAVARDCPHPEKDVYTTAQAAAFVLGKLSRGHRASGLRPYRCPAGGHFHLGRAVKRHPASAWKRAA